MSFSTLSPSPKTSALAAVFCCALATQTGCLTVTVYQPLVALQRPVAVDPGLPNFEGAKLLVRCIPGDHVDARQSQLLCGNLRNLFTHQGADVEVDVPRAGGSGSDESETGKPDLVIDLRSRLLHHDSSSLLTLACILSFTLIPAIDDYSAALDVTIRDPEGFLLASDTLQARFVEYTGVGVWGVNLALDTLVRPEPERLGADQFKKEFSKDLHAQLSQLAFNARMRAKVLKSFEATAPKDAK